MQTKLHYLLVSLLVSSLPHFAVADPIKTQHQSYISLGVQHTVVATDGMQTYFDNKYNNEDEAKRLTGYYVNANINFYQHYFIQFRRDTSTRISTDIAQNYLAAGRYFATTAISYWFASVGYADFNVDRETSNFEGDQRDRSNDGHNVAAEIGYSTKMAQHFSTEPSYRYSHFGNGGQHQFNLRNQILIGNHSAIELNLGYRHWDKLSEMDYQLGYRYRF